MTDIVFFGSDQYSTVVLNGLINAKNYCIKTIITTPPQPVGRAAIITPNPVEKFANMQNVKVSYYPPNNENLDNFIETLSIGAETVGLTASFPRLLPPKLIEKFAGRLYNIHPSLLPQYRNVAPVPYAIIMGDTITGVSIFQISSGIDNGQIVAQADHSIHNSDTTPSLLNQLFELGTGLFLKFLETPHDPSLISGIRIMRSSDLIFTRRLTREMSYLEWPILQRLIRKERIFADDTTNPLIRLRLTHYPKRSENILADLIRGLDGYEHVWTTAETKKGSLEIKLQSNTANGTFSVLIAGKPKPIPWCDFTKYYLNV